MIHYLPHSKIDKQKYDTCLSGAFNKRAYAFSAFLDRLSPQWDALVLMGKKGNYQKVMPLTWRKKWGIHYLYQPVMTQQLGVFSSIDKAPFRVDDFINAIPKKFQLIEISLNYGNFIATPKPRMEIKQRNNYELDLNKTYEELFRAYSKNHRKNINRHWEGLNKDISINNKDYLLVFKFKMKFLKVKGIAYSNLNKQSYRNLLDYCCQQNCLKTIIIKDEQENIAGGGNFLLYKDFILPSTFYLEKWKKNTLGYKTQDHIIKTFAGQKIIYDFMGSDIPGVAYRNKGFGSTQYNYPQLRINRLPYPINLIKNNFLSKN